MDDHHLWHRAFTVEFPAWELVRTTFLVHARRGWRRQLAARLRLGKSGMTKLLKRSVPSYLHYLGMVCFLEQQGVQVTLPVPVAEVRKIPEEDDPPEEKNQPKGEPSHDQITLAERRAIAPAAHHRNPR